MIGLRRVWWAALVVAALGCSPAFAQEPPPVDDRVAQVGVVPISLVEYERWYALAAHAAYERPVDPADIPPRRARSLHRDVMQFLIQGQWIVQEAARLGISIDEREVDRVFERQRRQAFPKPGAYERFLRRSGADEASIKHRIRIDELQNRITQKVAKRIRPVTKRAVARYRASHPRVKAKRARRILVARRQARALAGFIERFATGYRAKTWCADGYRIAECGAIAPPPVTPPQ